MFLIGPRFASNGVTMLLSLLTHLNPSSRKKHLLVISDLTRLEMGVGKISINIMSCIRGVSQRLKRVSMEQITPLSPIASLEHYRYPSINIR